MVPLKLMRMILIIIKSAKVWRSLVAFMKILKLPSSGCNVKKKSLLAEVSFLKGQAHKKIKSLGYVLTDLPSTKY